jgi:DNA-directed RNA polymerase specialized sigma subunit
MQELRRKRSCPELHEKEAMKYDFSTLTNSQLSELIDDWIRDERNMEILKDRFINCLTFDEIADKYCICERHVKRIVYKYGDHLLSKIK